MRFSFYNQMKGELLSLFNSYPGFIFDHRPPLKLNHIPVFALHTIDPALFEKELLYLKENNYQTLSLEEYFSSIARGGKVPEKVLLLTIDDGRLSFWKYGFPLLKKYQMKATLFIIPGSTIDSEKCRPSLLDVWDKSCSLSSLSSLDPDDEDLCTWSEIREMYRSGLVNIESHTLFHKEIFVSPHLVDFVKESTSFSLHNTSVSPYLSPLGMGRPLERQPFFGLPLFESAPFMEGRPALKIPRKLQVVCQNVYKKGSPASRQEGDEMREKMRETVHSFFFQNPPVYQGRRDVEKKLEEDLFTAKKIIQERLGSKSGNYLCLPYGVGSLVSIRAARRIGMQGCFWTTIQGKRFNTVGDDPFYQVRIKSDFIVRLPGAGRKSLLSIYAMKCARRIKGERVF